jgi:hypothetical protein
MFPAIYIPRLPLEHTDGILKTGQIISRVLLPMELPQGRAPHEQLEVGNAMKLDIHPKKRGEIDEECTANTTQIDNQHV